MKAFIIHGSFGSPHENWFPWLRTELESLGYEVITPTFPTPENQNLETWSQVFRPYLKNLDQDSILIGHSLGCAFLLNVLEKIPQPVKGVFLVSSFIGLLGNTDFDEVNQTFVDRNFDWESIIPKSENFCVYHGDDDHYVSLEKGQRVAKALGTPLKDIPNGGHLNAQAGFDRFEKLLTDVTTLSA